ncbi:MAG: aminoacyl-tRNA hydrolase [Ichthyobacteriaceae bacterium]|nr:aminoacyl-tRNA hydrolase [Ichthyobacteriaceae bacterium]
MKKFLIVGLGNIGSEYANTRHNIGFKILDNLASKHKTSFKSDKLGDRAEFKLKGRTFVLIKPSTYMNLSGKAVNYWMQKEKLEMNNVLIITDDVSLPFGSLRLKQKGSDGGHNGLKSVNEVMNTQKYSRFKFGIGNDFSRGAQIDFVLGEWSSDENKALAERLNMSASLVESFGLAGASNTMNTYNGK